MPDRFDAGDLEVLAGAEEIEIETAAHEGAPRHRTIIWVVVDDEERVLIRSYRGGSARWFREALANPSVTIHVDGRAISAAVVVANDEERIESASRGFHRKYPNDPAMPAMLSDAVLSTTLELTPQRAAARAKG